MPALIALLAFVIGVMIGFYFTRPNKKKLIDAQTRIAVLETEKSIFNEQHKEAQKNLEMQFENLANKIFENKNQQSQQHLNQILTPLKEKISEFQKKVEDSFGKQSQQHSALKAELDIMMRNNKELSSQAENLTNALKGNNKTQGMWGEMLLEKVLEYSGLRKGIEYIREGKDMELTMEEGSRLKPDVIIMLPDDKHIIIDAKISLIAYERYHAEYDDEEKREKNMKDFLFSIKTQIQKLEESGYHSAEKLNTPDFVLMFMPIESAYTLAIHHDPDLLSYAWERKIALVCPSTLLATLKLINSLWTLDRHNKNAAAIARQGASMYEKIFGFMEDMKNLGDKLSKSQEAYEDAMNKLAEGKGNLLNKAEKMKVLGAKTTKDLTKLMPEAFDEQMNEEESI